MLERTRCPISEKEAPVIFERPFNQTEIENLVPVNLRETVLDKTFKIRYSRDYDFYFQSWVLEEEELKQLYHTSKECDFKQNIANQKLHSFAHQTEEILVFRQLCQAKTPRVLDFGCSWGKWSSMALAHGCQVFGYDVDITAQEFCSKRGIQMLQWEELQNYDYDFINCDQVFEHVANPLQLIHHLSQYLSPKGFIKISTPQDKVLPNFLKKIELTRVDHDLNATTLDALYPLIHINLFSRKGLIKLGEKAYLKPYKLPLAKWLGAGQLWNLPRQINRNLRTPFKRWQGTDNYLWFTKTNLS